MLHELSFGCSCFVRASESALKLGLEVVVVSKDLLSLVVLEVVASRKVVSYSRFKLR